VPDLGDVEVARSQILYLNFEPHSNANCMRMSTASLGRSTRCESSKRRGGNGYHSALSKYLSDRPCQAGPVLPTNVRARSQSRLACDVEHKQYNFTNGRTRGVCNGVIAYHPEGNL